MWIIYEYFSSNYKKMSFVRFEWNHKYFSLFKLYKINECQHEQYRTYRFRCSNCHRVGTLRSLRIYDSNRAHWNWWWSQISWCWKFWGWFRRRFNYFCIWYTSSKCLFCTINSTRFKIYLFSWWQCISFAIWLFRFLQSLRQMDVLLLSIILFI